ncbi:ParB/RepB/Spo0J family partition protein [Streptomyces collinus]|uniref:ParB/RepB/Spo0J family partition protein n=1 Tax=Streptomyces collinus TaxID=42684 RepID=UPI003320C7B3
MSKADQLGVGRFGGGVRPVSARRQAVAAATGVPTEGVADPTELSVHRISLNPDNPRSSLGDLTDLAGSLKTHGQKQAITVMNRDAYLKANPAQETALEPDTTHVVVDGSTRLAAAREAGLATIKVMVSDDQGATSEELLESALVANIHRQDLEEIDEARALQRLLAIYGSQRALAKRLHRSQGWVSQRLALLNLTPELQARIGQEPIDLLRAVGNKPADQQEAALDEMKAERARKEQEETRATRAHHQRPAEGETDSTEAGPTGGPTVVTSVQDGGVADTGISEDRPVNAVNTSVPDAAAPAGEAVVASEAIPEPRVHSSSAADSTIKVGDEPRTRKVPYDEPGPLAMLLDTKIDSDDTFFALLRILIQKGLERDSARFGDLVRSLGEQVASKGD